MFLMILNDRKNIYLDNLNLFLSIRYLQKHFAHSAAALLCRNLNSLFDDNVS